MTDRLKHAVRRTYQTVRKQLSPAYQRETSDRICTQIRAFQPYRYAKHIALYRAANGEVLLDSLWQSAPLQGKQCYFPVLNEDQTLAFLPATPASHFCNNRFGIAEPDTDRATAKTPDQLAIIFVPLVAFDDRGTRLGMGQGYYDRTLAAYQKPLLVGVAYEFQCVSFLAADPWDIRLDVIFTERSIHRITS